mgnify:CR=1 FL=1
MEDFLNKLENYNILNYILPAIIFDVGCRYYINIELIPTDNIFISIFIYKKGTVKISKLSVNTTRNTTLFTIMSSKIFACASIIKTEEQIVAFDDFISILINRAIHFIFSVYIFSLYSFPSCLLLQ